MATIKVKAKDLATKTFTLPAGQSHQIVVLGRVLSVLDVEDSHFNFDRRVLLPDLNTTDGSAPVLDTRRVTGLGVIFAALTHAQKDASQGVCVTGHTDASGSAGYNQELSEDRAKNVSLLLRGLREDWRKHSASEDNVDDIQTVLTWQNQRSDFGCDPGPINNVMGAQTREAIGIFQERYNQEVDAQAGKDTPFRARIGVDKTVGPETWGAFYDLYMTELIDLLDLDGFSKLEAMQAALKVPPGMKEFVGCGEHIPFNPARRNPFEKGTDEHLEGPQKNPPDRRVEILFFDPGEEVPQVCHPKPGKCVPAECPIYTKNAFQQNPIGIPKGLPVAEINLKLVFKDPEGKLRPFPEGLEVEAKFGDPTGEAGASDDLLDPSAEDGGGGAVEPAPEPAFGGADPNAESMAVDQDPNEKTKPGGLLDFVVPRKGSSLFLKFFPGDKSFITADPKNLDDQKLATRDEALADVAKGRVFFELPKTFTSQEGYFKAPDGVKFDDGQFRDMNNRETQIGSRESPVELVLEVHWQHFKFDFFDRWTSSPTTVPQPRSKAADGSDVPPLVMDGMVFLFDPNVNPDPAVRTAWDVKVGKDTVHCLGWPRRLVASASTKRELPDDKCTARFQTSNLFVRTEGDGSSPDADRKFVVVQPADNLRTRPSVDRLRLYDVPRQWRSTDYPVRLGGEGIDKIRLFQTAVTTPSTVDKPYVASLDTIVLDDVNVADNKKPTLDDGPNRAVQNRYTIYDNQLRVHNPDTTSGENYFTRNSTLTRKPDSPVLHDFPKFTRLIARGVTLYDVFQDRTPDDPDFPRGFPVGARLAKQFPANTEVDSTFNKLFITDRSYFTIEPNGTSSVNPVFRTFDCGIMGLLRCCGHEGGGKVEKFMHFHFMSANFDFEAVPTNAAKEKKLDNPPKNQKADDEARDCLVAVAGRWNGVPVDYEIGSPVTARGRWRFLLTRGAKSAGATPTDGEVRINIFGKRRASQGGKVGNWQHSDMVVRANTGFTAAHEMGHALSLPDEYLNTDDEPSGNRTNIAERSRSPGTPYGLDESGMMGGAERLVRTRSFWHTAMWARERGYFTDATTISLKHGPNTFTTALTVRRTNRVQFAAATAQNIEVPLALGTGFCDQFVYVTGHDGWTAGELAPSSVANPFDGFITVRVKMQWTFDTDDFDDINGLLARAEAVIHNRFNKQKHLVARGVFDAKPVRLRYLFCPRFVLRTFPKGDGSDDYLKSLSPALTPQTKANYETTVDASTALHGIHALIRVSSSNTTPGVTEGAGGSPRRALVREDGFFSSRFNDDVALVFAQLVGLPDASLNSTAVFKPLADQLPAALSAVRLSFE